VPATLTNAAFACTYYVTATDTDPLHLNNTLSAVKPPSVQNRCIIDIHFRHRQGAYFVPILTGSSMQIMHCLYAPIVIENSFHILIIPRSWQFVQFIQTNSNFTNYKQKKMLKVHNTGHQRE
jgi:hypothetical protein